MTPVVKTGHDNNAADTPYATVSYGPLLFALAIPGHHGREHARRGFQVELRPRFAARRNWPPTITVERRPMPEKWTWQLDAPLKLHVQAKSFDWKPVASPGVAGQPGRPQRRFAVPAGYDHDALAREAGRRRRRRRGNRPDSLRLHEVPHFDVPDYRTDVGRFRG